MSGEGLLPAQVDCALATDELTPEVRAEREACLRAMRAVRQRFGNLPEQADEEDDLPEEIEAEAFRLELTRFDQAIDQIEQGLHRVGEEDAS